MISIISTNISDKKGTVKHPVKSINVDQLGVLSDAHAGKGNRQVSLLAQESIDRFSKIANRAFGFGEFAENLTVKGIELTKCRIFDQFRIGNVVLEITQIGKKCHGDGCAIYREVGQCVMPKEGLFCRVVENGEIKPGDIATYHPKIWKAHIITLSDRAFAGEYNDRSGPKISQFLAEYFTEKGYRINVTNTVIPDEPEQLESLILYALQDHADMVFTTGGTGIGPRDYTVDIVKQMFDKEIPGIMDYIRMKYGSINTNALISRSVAGIREKTLLFSLPGSVKAVEEYCSEIIPMLNHLFQMLYGIDSH